MKEVKILHISPENTAGVPFNVMKMQNEFGFYSRLITFYKSKYDFPEDICLGLKLHKGRLAMKWRDYKRSELRKELKEKEICHLIHMPYFTPKNTLEKFYMNLREKKNRNIFLKGLENIDSETFDIIHFDSGIDFFSDSRMAKKWKQNGKKIVNSYFGDDLRTRGIIREMDELSDLNLTFVYDHTFRHPDINFLFFPFNAASIKYISDRDYSSQKKIKIIHSPTDRFVKGTHWIINAIDKVKRNREIDFILPEKLPWKKLLEIKDGCHMAIDQIGNRGGTGYGINSLETLSMGIPTITDMNMGMDKWLPENPFIIANPDNLAEKIIELVDNETYRLNKRLESRKWVEKYHSYQSVFNKLNELYKKHQIISE